MVLMQKFEYDKIFVSMMQNFRSWIKFWKICLQKFVMHVHKFILQLFLPLALQVKSGLIRQEDQRNVSRSIREHVESAKQKMLKSQTSGVIIEDKKMLTSSTPEPPIVEGGGEPAAQQQQQPAVRGEEVYVLFKLLEFICIIVTFY